MYFALTQKVKIILLLPAYSYTVITTGTYYGGLLVLLSAFILNFFVLISHGVFENNLSVWFHDFISQLQAHFWMYSLLSSFIPNPPISVSFFLISSQSFLNYICVTFNSLFITIRPLCVSSFFLWVFLVSCLPSFFPASLFSLFFLSSFLSFFPPFFLSFFQSFIYLFIYLFIYSISHAIILLVLQSPSRPFIRH